MLSGSVVNLTTMTPVNGKIVTSIASGFFIDNKHIVTIASLVMLSPHYLLKRVQRILVTIMVEQTAQVVDAKLLGLSPINDVAVLEISQPICHTNLSLVDSRTVEPGTSVYVLGNLLNRDPRALTQGTIRDNATKLQQAPQLPELMDVDVYVGGGILGSPIVIDKGAVGMLAFTLNWQQKAGYLISTGTAIGPTSNTINTIVADILNKHQVVEVTDSYGNWLHWQTPSIGGVYSFVTPYLLLGNNIKGPIIQQYNQGAIMTTSPPLNEGDIILTINGKSIGYLESQTTIGQVLLHFSLGDRVTIGYTTKSSDYTDHLITDIELTPLANDFIYSSAQTAATTLSGIQKIRTITQQKES